MARPVIVAAVRTPVGERNAWVSGFHATQLLANCASRYENAPENPENKYKQTQGYKAATGRA